FDNPKHLDHPGRRGQYYFRFYAGRLAKSMVVRLAFFGFCFHFTRCRSTECRFHCTEIRTVTSPPTGVLKCSTTNRCDGSWSSSNLRGRPSFQRPSLYCTMTNRSSLSNLWPVTVRGSGPGFLQLLS